LDLDVNREQFSVRSVLERIDAAKSGRISYDQAKQVLSHSSMRLAIVFQ
jgi:hypothetical protein